MEKLATAERALVTLQEALREPYSVYIRDATIQRFEYTSEAAWKALQAYLLRVEKVEARHPRGCYQEAFTIGLVDESLCLALQKALDDRNLASHTYVEALAKYIYARIPQHVSALGQLLRILREKWR